jgi:hypothetical protein
METTELCSPFAFRGRLRRFNSITDGTLTLRYKYQDMCFAVQILPELKNFQTSVHGSMSFSGKKMHSGS